MVIERGYYYLVYAALVAITFVADQMLKKTDKKNRVIGYVISIVADLAMFGFGIYLYFAKGEDQTGFVLGGLLCLVCLLMLLGRYWQNKEADKRRRHDNQTLEE